MNIDIYAGNFYVLFNFIVIAWYSWMDRWLTTQRHSLQPAVPRSAPDSYTSLHLVAQSKSASCVSKCEFILCIRVPVSASCGSKYQYILWLKVPVHLVTQSTSASCGSKYEYIKIVMCVGVCKEFFFCYFVFGCTCILFFIHIHDYFFSLNSLRIS